MKTKQVLIWTLILVIGVIVVGVALSSQFTDPMAVHWNAQGEADGYGSRFMGIWFLPLITIGLSLLLLGIPAIDPLRKNIEKFRKEYNLFILLFVIFFAYLQVISLLYNLGWQFNLLALLTPAFGGFFYYIGVMLAKAKRNYFIGIRTPWTLAHEDVWNETHRVGAMGFKISGVLTIFGVVVPNCAIWFMMVPLLLVAFGTVIYSYFVYRKLHPENNGS